MDFLHRTPFFRLVVPLILGIVLYHYSEMSLTVICVCLSLAIPVVCGSFLLDKTDYNYKFRWLFGCGIFLFLLGAGMLSSMYFDRNHRFDQLNRKGIYRVELISSPVEKSKSIKCTIKLLNCCSPARGLEPARGLAILYLAKDRLSRQLLRGDSLLIEAEFRRPPGVTNPDGFDYASYLHRQGVGATCYVDSMGWHKCGHDASFSLINQAERCRAYLLDIYRNFSIKGDEFAVLAALTLGYTDDLQPDVMASYSATGAMHILSVSGMHVGIVYAVIAFALRFLNRSRRKKMLKAVFIILFLWAYAYLSGLSAAVIRAALMFSFVCAADCFNRKTNIFNTVFASAFFMLLFNPNYLFDVGFQLSYSAVLSIVFFQPILNKFYVPTHKSMRLLWSLFSVSVSAQLGTVPFTLYYFQQFPNYFLLTNLVAIPLSAVVLYLAILLPLIHVVPVVSVWVATLLEWSLKTLNASVAFIEHLPHSVWHVAFDCKQTIFVFAALFCFSTYYYNRKFRPFILGSVALWGVCLFNLWVSYDSLRSKAMVVYAGRKHSHVSFICGRTNSIFTTDSVELEQLAKAYWRKRKLAIPQNITERLTKEDGFANFEGVHLLILTNDVLKRKQSMCPLRLDYLIIANHMKPNIQQLLDCVSPRMIVVDQTISEWYESNIRECCKQRNIAFYAVAKQGAFVLRLND